MRVLTIPKFDRQRIQDIINHGSHASVEGSKVIFASSMIMQDKILFKDWGYMVIFMDKSEPKSKVDIALWHATRAALSV